MQYSRAVIQPSTLNVETREVEVVFATETPVERFGWEEDFNEVLSCEKSAIRWSRIDKGLPVVDSHNTGSIFNQIGVAVEVWVNDNRELCARIRFSTRPECEQLFKDIEAGIISAISVGYRVYKFVREEQGEGKLPIYRATDWEPHEISFTPVPADPNSGVRSDNNEHSVEIINAKPNNKKTNMSTKKRSAIEYTVEGSPVKAGDTIVVNGVDYTADTDGEVGDTITITPADDDESRNATIEYTVEDEPVAAGDTITVEGVDYIAQSDGEVGETITLVIVDIEEAERKATSAERKRLNAILTSTRAAKLPDAYAITLFNSKRSLSQCYAEIITKTAAANKRTVTGAHAAGVGATGMEKKRAAVQDALLHRLMPGAFKLTDAGRAYRGYTLVEISRELLAEAGVSTAGKNKMEIADMVFGRTHSSTDFPILFEGVIDKMLREPYAAAPEFWDKIARQTSVEDFRAKGLYTAGSFNGMKEVPEGGEINYTTMTEGKESIRVKSYAEGIRFTRQAFINDDLSAFSIIPTQFVKDWGALRGDNVWALLINNAKLSDGIELFHGTHKNLLTGADSTLSEQSLAAAEVMLSRQTTPDGRTLRVQPRYLIVPPELKVAAKRLMADITPTKSGDVNVFASEFDIIVENRLTDPTAWFLSADPNTIDTLYYAYLQGNEALRVHSENNFNVDSMDYAVRGDFGTAAIDFRGMVKSKGKA